MEHVARRESLDPELVRSEVARGRMIIPANTVHLSLGLEPMGIGIKARCKINANIGNSAVTSDIDNELSKLKMAVDLGSDTVMDLSTGGNIDAIRRAIIAASPVPVGTVPIYQAIQQVKKVEDLSAPDMLDMIEHQAKQGVDYMTIHAGILRDYIPLTAHRDHRDRLAGRLAHGPVDVRRGTRKTRSTPTSTICATSCGSTTSRSAWATACGPAASPTRPTPPSSPSSRRWAS